MLRQLTVFCSIALLSSSLAFAQSGSTKPVAPTPAPSAQGTQKSTNKKHKKHHKKAATHTGATTATPPAPK